MSHVRQAALINGDMRDVLDNMAGCTHDTVITDPPYGLQFMGKEWDHGVPGRSYWERVLRVAKPGRCCA